MYVKHVLEESRFVLYHLYRFGFFVNEREASTRGNVVLPPIYSVLEYYIM